MTRPPYDAGIEARARVLARGVAAPLGGSYVGVDTEEPVVAFTFDDGPDPAYTPAILDALRASGAGATFFVLGESATRHPDLVRRLVDEGHEVAFHGLSHDALIELSPLRRWSSLLEGRRAVTRAAGAAPTWFRPPYGTQTIDTVVASRLLRMRPVMWSAYAAEWEDRPLHECVARAADALVPGGILLLHDGAGGASDRPSRAPAEILELVDALLVAARERALRVVTVGELVAHGQPRRRFWFRTWKV